MSLACELRIGEEAARPVRRLARSGAWLAAAALALTAAQWLRAGVPWPLLAAATTIMLATGWYARRRLRPGACGTLQVDSLGRVAWASPDARVADGPPAAFTLVRWQFAPRFAWLELHPDGGGPVLRLALARSAFSAAQWAALGRWLTWAQRSGAGRPAAQPGRQTSRRG